VIETIPKENQIPVLTGCHVSSLVVDSLCEHARGCDIAIACFYFDYPARMEQSAAKVLGSLLRQIVSGLESIPEEVLQNFQDQKKVLEGQGLQTCEIVKMLQAVTSSRRTFICVDAIDECGEEHRPDILDSLRQVLERSPSTRLFITGRRHIRDEVQKHLAGEATILSIKPNEGDIKRYIRTKLSKDIFPDAMDNALEAEIVESIPKNMSEMYVGVI